MEAQEFAFLISIKSFTMKTLTEVLSKNFQSIRKINFVQPDIFSRGWNDEVFNHHYKEYGAYELRRHYQNRMMKSMMVSITAMALIFLFAFYIQNKVHIIIPEIPTIIPGTITDIIPPVIDEIKPPVDNIKKPSSSTITAFTKDTSSETLPKDTSALKSSGSGAGNDTSGTKKTGTPIGNPGGGSSGGGGFEKDSAVIWVPDMPEYPGGMIALQKFISQKIRTNNQWRENGKSGKVVYEFVVGRDGKVRDYKIYIDEVKYGMAEMNLAIFPEMLRWKPGRNNGHEVSVMFRLPLKFEKD